MNASARGNVTSAKQALQRVRRLIARWRTGSKEGRVAEMCLELIDDDLALSIEDLERAVVLDDQTKAA